MRLQTEALAADIRDLYLRMDRNYTREIGLDHLKSAEIDLTAVLGAAREAEFLADLERLHGTRGGEGGGESLGFHAAFDFEKDNHAIEQKRHGHRLLVDEIGAMAKERGTPRVVSLGIGDGKVTAGYADAVAPGDLIGIDLHADFLERAEEAIPGLVVHAPFDLNTLAEGAKLDLADASADVVECSMVAHHVQDFDALVAEVARILRPGGVFFYFDLIDKTRREDTMVFADDHAYPAFHGYEFFRDHQEIRAAMARHLNVERVVRVSPGMLYITGRA